MFSFNSLEIPLKQLASDILIEKSPENVLPDQEKVTRARGTIVKELPEKGIGLANVWPHLKDDIGPGLNGNSLSANYYGFVTGGITPAARVADYMVTSYDQNVQVHLPNETIATNVEDAALRMLCNLFQLNPEVWPHRTFTTGATASNIVGLACGREAVINKMIALRQPESPVTVGEVGLVRATRLAGIEDVQIVTTVPHSSLGKAASILGLGRSCVKLINRDEETHLIDLEKLKNALDTPNVATIVSISCSEVNTGSFATFGEENMKEIRRLCDQYGAWIHVDGAFGIFGRLLDDTEYGEIRGGCLGIELADSIAGDAHKLLNVPYDCGFVFTRDRDLAVEVFQNANAAYLSGGSSSDVASPLNIGLENSRRFRALPVYASLLAYGRDGYSDMVRRQVALCRGIAEYLDGHSHFELLPERHNGYQNIFIIVLFRAKHPGFNKELVALIKDSLKVYVSGTSWKGSPACRFAVSNWQVDPENDLKIIQETLNKIAKTWQESSKS